MQDNRFSSDEHHVEESVASGWDCMKHARNKTFVSDQDKKLPQPPLTKRATEGCLQIALPHNFDDLNLGEALVKLLYMRKTCRAYTDQPMTLLELSFLIWAQQGIKGIRGNNYSTLRTVPCSGARHEFELYVLVRNVEGLEPGAYHYLPISHSLELLKTASVLEESNETLSDMLVHSYYRQA